MYQDFDPMHNIPRGQIVRNPRNNNTEINIIITSILLFGLAGFFLWGAWVKEVVPDKYVFNPDSQPADTDYSANRR